MLVPETTLMLERASVWAAVILQIISRECSQRALLISRQDCSFRDWLAPHHPPEGQKEIQRKRMLSTGELKRQAEEQSAPLVRPPVPPSISSPFFRHGCTKEPLLCRIRLLCDPMSLIFDWPERMIQSRHHRAIFLSLDLNAFVNCWTVHRAFQIRRKFQSLSPAGWNFKTTEVKLCWELQSLERLRQTEVQMSRCPEVPWTISRLWCCCSSRSSGWRERAAAARQLDRWTLVCRRFQPLAKVFCLLTTFEIKACAMPARARPCCLYSVPTKWQSHNFDLKVSDVDSGDGTIEMDPTSRSTASSNKSTASPKSTGTASPAPGSHPSSVPDDYVMVELVGIFCINLGSLPPQRSLFVAFCKTVWKNLSQMKLNGSPVEKFCGTCLRMALRNLSGFLSENAICWSRWKHRPGTVLPRVSSSTGTRHVSGTRFHGRHAQCDHRPDRDFRNERFTVWRILRFSARLGRLILWSLLQEIAFEAWTCDISVQNPQETIIFWGRACMLLAWLFCLCTDVLYFARVPLSCWKSISVGVTCCIHDRELQNRLCSTVLCHCVSTAKILFTHRTKIKTSNCITTWNGALKPLARRFILEDTVPHMPCSIVSLVCATKLWTVKMLTNVRLRTNVFWFWWALLELDKSDKLRVKRTQVL